jgi:hypothetical protein
MCGNQVKNLKVAKVVGWLPLGLASIGMSLLLPNFLHPAGRFSVDWLDGVRGLLGGIGIGIELMVVVKLALQRRHSQS